MVLIRINPPEFLSAGAWSRTRLFRPLALGRELTHFFLSQVVALLPDLDPENEGDGDSSATDVRVQGLSFPPDHSLNHHIAGRSYLVSSPIVGSGLTAFSGPIFFSSS